MNALLRGTYRSVFCNAAVFCKVPSTGVRGSPSDSLSDAFLSGVSSMRIISLGLSGGVSRMRIGISTVPPRGFGVSASRRGLGL